MNCLVCGNIRPANAGVEAVQVLLEQAGVQFHLEVAAGADGPIIRQADLARDTDVELHWHGSEISSVRAFRWMGLGRDGDHSAVSVSLSCLSDFRVSLTSRDCLRCRRSPAIRRAMLARASVRVA